MMSDVQQAIARSSAKHLGDRLVRLLAVAALGLALGGCTKCDVWNWVPNQPPQAPHSCHDGPSPQ
ncbi:MAG: hypothetical protein ABSE22_01185 [Xanthobacteraceae bacterium]|jgi:hypothetical protein